jgi:F-type H+-transporting ATPase subunit epsilon
MRLFVTTPQGALVEADAEEVIAPGSLGEFGVLPGHIPFLSTLRPGVFSYRTKDGPTRHYAVGEGVIEVARTPEGGDKVLVLVDRAVSADEVDRDEAAKQVAADDAELAAWKKDFGGEWKALTIRRAWAQARLDATARRS